MSLYRIVRSFVKRMIRRFVARRAPKDKLKRELYYVTRAHERLNIRVDNFHDSYETCCAYCDFPFLRRLEDKLDRQLDHIERLEDKIGRMGLKNDKTEDNAEVWE